MVIKAFLFDMDGTLVDSMQLWTRAFNDNLKQYDKNVDFSHGKYGGSPIEFILKEIFDNNNTINYSELITKILERAEELLSEKAIPFMPGAKEFVEVHSKTKKCAICSGSSLKVIQSVMNNNNFTQPFSALLSAEDVPNGKPAPDVWLEAAKQLGVKPEECIVFEDAISGMVGGKAAGMTVIGIVREKSNKFPADKLYNSFEEINLDEI